MRRLYRLPKHFSMADRSISPPLTKRRRLNSIPGPDTKHPTSIEAHNSTKDDLNIYSWNVNGIQPFIQKPITSFFKAPTKSSTSSPRKDDAPPSASLRDVLRRNSWPTMLLLQEVKIAPSDTVTQRQVQQAVRAPSDSSEPDYEASFCLPRDKYNARGFGGKVYGVCSIVRTDFLRDTSASIRTVDWDLEGRVQVIETHPTSPSNTSDPDEASSSPEDLYTPLPRLAIFNIYAVNGTSNPYKSPVNGAVSGTRHDRKRAFHAALLSECKSLEARGYSVILAGDMNVARHRIDGHPNLRTRPEDHVVNRRDFNEKFFDDEDGLKAIDTLRELYPERKGYTYYPRGGTFGESCDRVDLIICSKGLRERIVSAGMLETVADRGTSDHVPLFASFRFLHDAEMRDGDGSVESGDDDVQGDGADQSAPRRVKRLKSR